MSEVKHSNVVNTEAFRDRIATVDELGRRKWIYAYAPRGKYYTIRTILSIVYFLLFFGLPFAETDGKPLFQFNIPEAKFILFGKIFWPQDFFIFGLVMVTFVFFIVLFTAAFGRLFCGWACPQTNFMEMMFRKVEYWVLGDAPAQKQLQNAPWTRNKILKVGVKHILFFLLSFIIANFFLAYIIGIKELEKIITEPVTAHLGGFASIIVFCGIFYGVYAFFREQACTVVCPYGRLQSVLLDKNSMIVAYDYKRGEPRGNFKKQAQLNLGDCIDCHQCVKVCPTGIDIRNGVQMECVGCTACIDACNHIMDSVHKPRGLIRYTSENSIAKGEPLRYTTRMKLYTGLCVLLLTVVSIILITRNDVAITVIRTAGMLYQERGEDSLSNLYNINMINKTTKDLNIELKLTGTEGSIQMVGNRIIKMRKEAQASGTFFIVLPKQVVTQRKTIVKLAIFENGKQLAKAKTNFLGPAH